MNFLKFMLITIIISITLPSNIHAFSQCRVINSYNNCITEYCYCPKLYVKHRIEYSNGKNCYFCQPNCNIFECSLIHCYCEEGYKIAKIDGCYKCLLNF